MMGGYGMGFGFGGFFMLLWWVLIIVGIVALVKWLGHPHAGQGGSDKAIEILRERYARGEIDEQEFQKRKRDLS